MLQSWQFFSTTTTVMRAETPPDMASYPSTDKPPVQPSVRSTPTLHQHAAPVSLPVEGDKVSAVREI